MTDTNVVWNVFSVYRDVCVWSPSFVCCIKVREQSRRERKKIVEHCGEKTARSFARMRKKCASLRISERSILPHTFVSALLRG